MTGIESVGVRGRCGKGGELSGPRLLRGAALSITVMSLISLSGSLPLTVKASDPAAPAAPPEDRRDDLAETLLLGVSKVHHMVGGEYGGWRWKGDALCYAER